VTEVLELRYSKGEHEPESLGACRSDGRAREISEGFFRGSASRPELVNVTRQYLARHGVEAEVEFSWGATEVKAPELVDRDRRADGDRFLARRETS